MNRLASFISVYIALVAVLLAISVIFGLMPYASAVALSLTLGLVLEGIGYGFFLAWRSVVRGFRGTSHKPSATNAVQPVAQSAEISGTRRLVLNCSSFTHPHVHTFLSTGQVRCEEEAAAKANPFKLPSSKGSPPDVGIPPNTGHYTLLVALTFVALASYATTLVLPYLIHSYASWAGIPDVLVGFASAEVIWEDSKAINQKFEEKVIAAGWWSLFGFLVPFLGVPLYAFERRKTAISARR